MYTMSGWLASSKSTTACMHTYIVTNVQFHTCTKKSIANARVDAQETTYTMLGWSTSSKSTTGRSVWKALWRGFFVREWTCRAWVCPRQTHICEHVCSIVSVHSRDRPGAQRQLWRASYASRHIYHIFDIHTYIHTYIHKYIDAHLHTHFVLGRTQTNAHS